MLFDATDENETAPFDTPSDLRRSTRIEGRNTSQTIINI
jgi:hypothetical protein